MSQAPGSAQFESPNGGADEVRARMRQQFDSPFAGHNDKWDSLWQKADFLPWDRGLPNPALEDLLKQRSDLLGSPVTADGRRRRALVPGCGRGYDVLLLASMGYDAYGLDVSPGAVRACEELAKAQFHTYASDPPSCGVGSYRFFAGDFFKDDWQSTSALSDGFDVLYDYTFLCALPPEARPAWAKRYQQLLRKAPDSRLICLEFPTYKDPSTRGPPWGLRHDVYEAHLTRPGEEIPYVNGYPDETAYSPLDAASLPADPGKALVRIARWQPDRTHEIGKGTDWVSVWRLGSHAAES